MTINISKEFSKTPGGRYKNEGKYSGEEFRESILIPRYKEAREKNEKLTIELDGGYGYAASFLDEAFNGLAQLYGKNEVNSTLEFISKDEPSLIAEIRGYIVSAKDKKSC